LGLVWAWTRLGSINPDLDLNLGLGLLKTQAWTGLDLVDPGLDLDLGLGVLKVWAWTGLGPENQAQVQVGLQDLAKLLIPAFGILIEGGKELLFYAILIEKMLFNLI